MHARRTKRASGDDGVAMVMALVFLFVMSIVIFALLGQAEANFRTTVIVNSRSERMYAADAAIEAGIERLRLDPTLCSASGTGSEGATIAVPPMNKRDVVLKCKPTGFDDDLGASGWAAIVRGTLRSQAGGEPTLRGPVFVTRDPTGLANKICAEADDNNCLIIDRGNIVNNSGSCGEATPEGLLVKPDPPYRWLCDPGAQIPDPPHALPPTPGPTSTPDTPDPIDECTIWAPGTYTSPPDLAGKDNLFVAGVYYFEFTEPNTTFDIPNDKNVIGGHADSYDVDELDGTPCANVPDSAGAGSTGSGVEWIFGGTSKLLINGANVELTTRTPTAGDPRINIYAVDVAQDLYLAETPGTIVVDAKNPSAKFTAHGMAYGPTANFEIFASKNTLAAFQNGIVANDLLVKPSEPGVGLSISVDVAEHTRTVLLTATARSNGESDFVVDARVEIRDDTLPPTMVVQSWRTCSIPAPSDPLLFPMPACP